MQKDVATNCHDVNVETQDMIDQSISETGGASNENALRQAESTIAELKDEKLHLMAECQNIRMRAEKKNAEDRQYAVTNFARETLSVLDNLQRALDNVSEDVESPLMQGVQMTFEHFYQILQRFGVQPIDALGQVFNPHLHQVISEQPAENEDQKPGTVIQVLQTGYMIHERLLRPSLVNVVAKKSDASKA